MRTILKDSGHIKPLKTRLIIFANRLAAAAFLTLTSALPVHHAMAVEKQAAMVIDANSGRTLYSRSGDDLRHPASLTKIMTLYMVFELLDQGRIKHTTRIRISSQAAAQPPSRIGLKVGKTIRLNDAMKALVTKSANDIAVAIAEHVAGSESKFARLMTAKARAIGMTKTVFKNASGLPNDEQVTTARDMLRLAMRIQEQFPKHYTIFKTKYFTYRGKTYKNHNRLLGRVKGVDGIKTGYIRKSGFNLVTSVKTGGKHIVAAVFGGKTSRARNREMKGLIAKLLPVASNRRTRPMLIARPQKAARPTRIVAPARRPVSTPSRQVVATPIEVGRAKRIASPATIRHTVAIAKVQPVDLNQFTRPLSAPHERWSSPSNYRPSSPTPPTPPPPAEPVQVKTARPPGTLHDQLARLLSKRSDPPGESNQRFQFGATGTKQEPKKFTPYPPDAGTSTATNKKAPYQIQVGAYVTHRDAEQRLDHVTRHSNGLLRGHLPLTQEVARGSRKLYRARFAGFNRASATQTCRELQRRSIDCLVTRER